MEKLKNSKIIHNFLSLASVQVLNYLLPLITLPYLMRVVGVSNFGLISFAQAIMQYFILFTDYGFNLIATRDISKARKDEKRVSAIFCSVMAAKLILLVISFAILVVLIIVVPKFKQDALLYLFTFGMVVGNVLFPTWFFQGIEEMKVISLLNVFSKIIFTVGIFIIVKKPSDFLNVAILNSLGFMLIGVLSIIIVFSKYNVKLTIPKRHEVINQMKEGWDIFLSNMFSSLYTTSNTVILGFLASNEIVGYFSAADKIIKACSSVISPIIQAVYPHISIIIERSKEEALLFIRKIGFWITIVIGAGCLILLFGSPVILPIFAGNNYDHSIVLIQIMSFLPLIIGWANILGILTLINFGYQKELSRIYIYSSLFSIITTIILVPLYKEVGTAINVTLIEAIVTAAMYYVLKKKGINIISGKIINMKEVVNK
ncbi:flippase [Carnobacterium gallinarum]|uniref:flippase n=1 Tax=Carnobacterium gallinarum TaxID=2749 RepID=UPI00055204C0|nr:flippase [Carnobacterium gallinarum]